MHIKFYFQGNTVTSDIIRNGFTYTQNYHNNLQPADNFIKLTVPYDENLSDYLKYNIDNSVKCEVINDDNSIYFRGFLKKNVSFTKQTRNRPIALEITSGVLLLDQKFKDSHSEASISLSSAVEYILDYAGITDYSLTGLPAKTIAVFTVTEGDSVKDTLKALLFEYGYIFDFNKENKLIVNPLFNIPEDQEDITQLFTDGLSGNIYGTLTQTATSKEYDGVSAVYNQIEYAENQLIFNDADSHVIPGNGYLYDNELGCYTEYDSSKGAVKHITEVTSWKVTGSNGSISNTSPTGHGLSGSFINYGHTGLINVHNTGNTDNTVSLVQVYGSGYFITAAEKSNTVEGNKLNEITLKYISGASDADTLVQNLVNYYRYASFKITLSSKVDYNYGSFVLISADGMGTIAGRIIQKEYNLTSSMVKYTIEAVNAFSEVELENLTNKASNNNPTIDQVGQIVEEVAAPIIAETVGPIVEEAVGQKIVTVYPRYIGSYATAPDNASCRKGDWYFNTTPDAAGQVHLYINNYDVDSDTYSWDVVEYGADTDYMFTAAAKDVLNYTADTGEVGQFASIFVSHLFAQKITIANGGSIQSENFETSAGVYGFKLDSNGDIYANSGRFRAGIGAVLKFTYDVFKNGYNLKDYDGNEIYIYKMINYPNNDGTATFTLLARLFISQTGNRGMNRWFASGEIYDSNTVLYESQETISGHTLKYINIKNILPASEENELTSFFITSVKIS